MFEKKKKSMLAFIHFWFYSVENDASARKHFIWINHHYLLTITSALAVFVYKNGITSEWNRVSILTGSVHLVNFHLKIRSQYALFTTLMHANWKFNKQMNFQLKLKLGKCNGITCDVMRPKIKTASHPKGKRARCARKHTISKGNILR